MARIALTGGTGFVGTHMSRALSRAGHEVRLLARHRPPPQLSEGAGWRRADVVDGEGLADGMRGCDAAVNLVAVIRERGGQTFERVNAQGAANVAKAARAAGIVHLVHLSAIGVDPDPRYAYLASKWEGEQAVRGARVPYTVLRPSLLFGPGDGFFTVLARLIRRSWPVVPVVGDGRALFQPLAVSDLARIVAQCLDEGPRDGVDEVGGPDHLTYEQIVDVIIAELDVRRHKAHVPVPLMLPAAAVFDRLLRNPPVTPSQLRLLEKSNITRLDSVPRRFGFEPLSFARNCSYLQDY